KEALESHRITCRKEKPHVCDHCGKRFKDKYNVKYHVKNVHGTVKRYECEKCGVKFKSNAIFRVHRRRFNGKCKAAPIDLLTTGSSSGVQKSSATFLQAFESFVTSS